MTCDTHAKGAMMKLGASWSGRRRHRRRCALVVVLGPARRHRRQQDGARHRCHARRPTARPRPAALRRPRSTRRREAASSRSSRVAHQRHRPVRSSARRAVLGSGFVVPRTATSSPTSTWSHQRAARGEQREGRLQDRRQLAEERIKARSSASTSADVAVLKVDPKASTSNR